MSNSEASAPAVSVIVPVYNVSEFLRKCLDSILRQTEHNIEIIIVNDCSPDLKDHEICLEYKKIDQRVVYIEHEENKGLGEARNSGIKVARGQYVVFVDSDDWIAENMIKTMLKKIISKDYDIVACNFVRVVDGYEKDGWYKYQEEKEYENLNGSLSIYEDFQSDKNAAIVYPNAWAKMFKKSLFQENNVYFPEKLKYEDTATTPKLLYYAKRILMINDSFYYYLVRNGSIMQSKPDTSHVVQGFEIIRNFLVERKIYDEYEDRFLRSLVYFRVNHFLTYLRANSVGEEAANEIRLFLNQLENKKYITNYLAQLNATELCDLIGFNNNENVKKRLWWSELERRSKLGKLAFWTKFLFDRFRV